MTDFLKTLFNGTFEISYAILFVALLIFQIYTSAKREERLSNRIEEQTKLIYQLTMEVRRIEHEAFKR